MIPEIVGLRFIIQIQIWELVNYGVRIAQLLYRRLECVLTVKLSILNVKQTLYTVKCVFAGARGHG